MRINLTYQKFNVTPHNSSEQTWFYGITLEEFNNSQVFYNDTW
jgi:hypothetical protein